MSKIFSNPFRQSFDKFVHEMGLAQNGDGTMFTWSFLYSMLNWLPLFAKCWIFLYYYATFLSFFMLFLRKFPISYFSWLTLACLVSYAVGRSITTEGLLKTDRKSQWSSENSIFPKFCEVIDTTWKFSSEIS